MKEQKRESKRSYRKSGEQSRLLPFTDTHYCLSLDIALDTAVMDFDTARVTPYGIVKGVEKSALLLLCALMYR